MSTETETVLDYWQEIEQAQDLADARQAPVRVVRDVFGHILLKMPWHILDDDSTLHLAIPTYRTLDDIKERNRRLGHCWFSPDTMRFFSSRVQSTIYPTKDGRAYFVTSERGPDNIRKYSVRVAFPSGLVNAVGEFQQYRTGRAAHAAARRLAEGGSQCALT